MDRNRDSSEETGAEKRMRYREENRGRKKRKRMPLHGAGLKKIPQIWASRSKKTKDR